MQDLHATARGSSSTAPLHKALFPVQPVALIKPFAAVPARAPTPTLFSRPITSVIAPAQPTSGPASSNTTPAAPPCQNITSKQSAIQESSAAVAYRTRRVSIAAPAPDTDDDSSSSDKYAGNNNSNRCTSSTPPWSFR